MSADWSAMWVCFCGLQNHLRQNVNGFNHNMERMGAIVSKIKVEFMLLCNYEKNIPNP